MCVKDALKYAEKSSQIFKFPKTKINLNTTDLPIQFNDASCEITWVVIENAVGHNLVDLSDRELTVCQPVLGQVRWYLFLPSTGVKAASTSVILANMVFILSRGYSCFRCYIQIANFSVQMYTHMKHIRYSVATHVCVCSSPHLGDRGRFRPMSVTM